MLEVTLQHTLDRTSHMHQPEFVSLKITSGRLSRECHCDNYDAFVRDQKFCAKFTCCEEYKCSEKTHQKCCNTTTVSFAVKLLIKMAAKIGLKRKT